MVFFCFCFCFSPAFTASKLPSAPNNFYVKGAYFRVTFSGFLHCPSHTGADARAPGWGIAVALAELPAPMSVCLCFVLISPPSFSAPAVGPGHPTLRFPSCPPIFPCFLCLTCLPQSQGWYPDRSRVGTQAWGSSEATAPGLGFPPVSKTDDTGGYLQCRCLHRTPRIHAAAFLFSCCSLILAADGRL